MYSSGNTCKDDCIAKHVTSFQSDPTLSNSCESDMEEESDKKTPWESTLRTYNASGSSDLTSVTDIMRRNSSSIAAPCERSINTGRQAKRARVENIIKGMTPSPRMCCREMLVNFQEDAGSIEENDKMQEMLLHQDHMQKSDASQYLGQFSARMDGVSDLIDMSKEGLLEERTFIWNHLPSRIPGGTSTNCHSVFERNLYCNDHGWKKAKVINYLDSKPEKVRMMANVLKYELSRAVSRSVDSIFKRRSLLQVSQNREGSVDLDMSISNKRPFCTDKDSERLLCNNKDMVIPDVQTEALALVVKKSRVEPTNKITPHWGSTSHYHPESLANCKPLCKNPASEKNPTEVHQNTHTCFQGGRSEPGQTKFASWNTMKVGSKVISRCIPQIDMTVDPVLLETLCHPHVKMEPNCLLKNDQYMLNESLTTVHLKKAKLMFFYTRYPSSLVLKMCFSDVQFTRCITSQLIKWFSNFREFYYIQMEKFARRAIVEQVADFKGLTVGRETDIFRVLNMHYNKANDFQVPDGFLEVAEITLREFYMAISMGKDQEPSWKKAIYKVICKLDREIPAEFKRYG